VTLDVEADIDEEIDEDSVNTAAAESSRIFFPFAWLHISGTW